MINELVNNKICYKIFDKNFKESSQLYITSRANDKQEVAEIQHNRQLVIKEMEATNLLILKQVHGNKIIDSDIIADFSSTPEGDGAVTTLHKIALSIRTADCVPVLLSCDEGRIIGVAHCGWKGSKADIIHNLVHFMKSKGAKTLQAVIGPSIQQQSYEVDYQFVDDFVKQNADNQKFFILTNDNQKFMFDLPAYVMNKLQYENITDITRIMEDTYLMVDKYPSYRRFCHVGEQLGDKPGKSILSTIIIR